MKYFENINTLEELKKAYRKLAMQHQRKGERRKPCSGQQGRKEGRTMKRYRDSAGQLTMTVDEIAAATLDEAREYYQDGGRYIYEGRPYTLRRYTDRDAHGNAVEIAQFVGIDGYNLFTDPARLGTFLPGVASDGLEITRF